MEKSELIKKNISTKSNFDTNYNKFYKYTIWISFCLLIIVIWSLYFIYQEDNYSLNRILILIGMPFIYLIFVSTFVFIGVCILKYRSKLFELKLKEIDWTSIYYSNNKNKFDIENVTLNKFNISYFELKQLIEDKVEEINILNSIIINLNKIKISISYEKVIINKKMSELNLIYTIELDSRIENKGKINKILDLIKLKNSDEIIESNSKKLLKFKKSLCSIDKILEEIKKHKGTRTYRTMKTTKNRIKEINNNILGLFYSVLHNQKNMLQEYEKQINKDIEKTKKIFI
ncbi:hypothetical protein [Spiroplasma endosymbiont of Dioctria linearis]|uniref:hypothetical protein n=1 Tax=Spiroplasma endosymbiont of Dioctria linearis TaxID=3066290 RepID=UPI00313D5368